MSGASSVSSIVGFLEYRAHNKSNNYAPSAQDAAKPRLFLRRYVHAKD
jgi:hypothetical protein